MAGNQRFLNLSASSLMPQEEMLEVGRKRGKLIIGIPRETVLEERRVALVPEAVSVLTQNGHKVIYEAKAGIPAHFSDMEYTEAGADIVFNAEEVFKADIILKVAPLSFQEINYLKGKQTVISSLQMGTQSAEYFRQLMIRKVTTIAFELIKDKTGSFPIIRAMSEIAGTSSVLLAAEYLSHPDYGKGRLLGGFPGITPTEVVILGAGAVGEVAARAAMGMGALVKVFDNNIYKLRRIQDNLSNRVFTSIIHPKVLLKALRTADVVIGAIHAPAGRTPCVVTEAMVREMKSGSVVIDVSIDQGGCFETSRITTHSNPVYTKHDVTHYCVPNIPSRVPNSASYALSNFFVPILLTMGEEGGIERFLKIDYGLLQGVYLFNGILVNKFIGENFGIPSQDIELLMAAFG
ncbi:MAG: alanine dehydrogenase [Bacteroidota bacterium]